MGTPSANLVDLWGEGGSIRIYVDLMIVKHIRT